MNLLYKTDNKILIYKILSVVFAIFILAFSVIPRDGILIGGQVDSWGYLIHFGSYFVLCVLVSKSILYKYNTFMKSFFIVFSYGLLLEFIQFFIPYRTFDLLDIVANGFGAGLVYLGFYLKLNVFKYDVVKSPTHYS